MSHSVDPKAIVDLRALTDYRRGHLAGSAHFQWPQLQSEMYLLPDRHVPLWLVGEQGICAQAKAFLNEKGYQIEKQLLSTDISNCGVRLEPGEQSNRLWQPCATVEEAAGMLDLSGKKVLDLGCGAGRDAVFLASAGAKVIAIDYIEDMAERVGALAKSENTQVQFICEDLESPSNPLMRKAEGEWQFYFDLILGIRFLNRGLFPVIKQLLATQGLLVWHTFMRGCEQFGSPKNPNFLLEENELADYFSDFSIVKNEKITLADGRPVNAFIARKIH